MMPSWGLSGAAATLVGAEARVAALSAGAPAAKLAGILKLADLSDVEVTDGEVDQTAVKAAIATVKKDYPELFGAQPSGPASSGADFTGAPQGKRTYTEAEIKAMSTSDFFKAQDDINAAYKEGRVVA